MEKSGCPEAVGDRSGACRQGVGAVSIAALDLGSNNCRLLVARCGSTGQIRIVDSFSRIVRLAEGVTLTGQLSDAAMRRTADALAVCVGRMTRHGVGHYRAVATAACRAAGNGPAFLDAIRSRFGLRIDLIDAEEEMRLAVAGCRELIDADPALLVDIGGGSTELAIVAPDDTRHVAGVSLALGAVGLAEQAGDDLVRMRQIVRRRLADIGWRTDHLPAQQQPAHLIGTSGTVTSLAGFVLGLERYDRLAVDGLWLSRGEVDAAIEQLAATTLADRTSHPCIGPGRADLVLAGAAILQEVWASVPASHIRVADRGLREGMLLEIAASISGQAARPAD